MKYYITKMFSREYLSYYQKVVILPENSDIAKKYEYYHFLVILKNVTQKL